MCDDQAKQASPIMTPFVPTDGCRHIPVWATVPVPGVPRPLAEHRSFISQAQIRKHLQQPQVPALFQQQVRPALCGLDPDVSIDQVLMTGWEAVHKNIMSRELRQELQHPAQMSSNHAGTDLPYRMAHAVKNQTPEQLEAPMRTTLLQHLLVTVKDRMEKMMETPSSRSTAISLGWLSENDQELMGLKWDQEAHRHVRDVSVTPIRIDEAMGTLAELIALIKEPLVVARYHATRPLSEQYQAPTLTMLLEIGLRTSAAHTVWSGLNKLAQSALWVAAGAFLRQERIQRSPLAQKLAALSKSLG